MSLITTKMKGINKNEIPYYFIFVSFHTTQYQFHFVSVGLINKLMLLIPIRYCKVIVYYDKCQAFVAAFCLF